MARHGLSREQVFATATALADEGIQPTVKLIRERIGGSFSTITPHLAAWREDRGSSQVASLPDMPQSLAAVCRSIWAAAWKASQEAIQTERDGLNAARRDMERERGELTREITDLETKVEALADERDTLTRKATETEAARTAALDEVYRLRVENARLEEGVANTERRAEELRHQVERLEGEFARLAALQRAERAEAAGEEGFSPRVTLPCRHNQTDTGFVSVRGSA